MIDIEDIFALHPYALTANDKHVMLDRILSELTRHHYMHSNEYRRMIDSTGFDPGSDHSYTDIPFLPVRLFKQLELSSIDKADLVKTMTSSGTTGQSVSRIFLDKETSARQTKALTKIVSAFIGKQRLPILIIDSEATVTNRQYFSARTAGILGFSIFASSKTYALDQHMNLDIEKLVSFVNQYKGQRVFIFGFTFIIWQHLYKELERRNIKVDLSNAVLIHGGGWKKLVNESVSPDRFKERLKNTCGISDVHDYYGMVEQTGSIYMECEEGHLHAPVYSDIITRRAHDFSMADHGEKGLIQVVSVLPLSYPGHSLLTEDEGVILGEDDCNCGRPGKYFLITGRVKNAELRGCSDVYAEQF